MGVLAHRHQAGLVLGHQQGQAVGSGDDVVVHQPDPVESLVVRRLHAGAEAARTTGVGVEVDALEPQGAPAGWASRTARVWSVLALSTTITASGSWVCAARPSRVRPSRSARL